MPTPRKAVQGWRAICDEESARPKKPELLDRAVEHLGPFECEIGAEALTLGSAIDPNGGRHGLTRELAESMVEDAARTFNAEKYLHDGAPRAKDAEEQLIAVGRVAANFVSVLRSLNDDTLHELHTGGSEVRNAEEFAALRKAAEKFMLPQPASYNAGDNGKTLLAFHFELSNHARATLQNWRSRRQRERRVDRGGKTNLWREHAGAPEWALVNDTLHIYQMFKPGKATGHVNRSTRSSTDGDYHAFVLTVYEFATGLNPENANLDKWIKKLPKLHRKSQELESRLQELDATWHAMIGRDSRDLNEEELSKLAEIEAEEKVVREKAEALKPKIWPHHYRA